MPRARGLVPVLTGAARRVTRTYGGTAAVAHASGCLPVRTGMRARDGLARRRPVERKDDVPRTGKRPRPQETGGALARKRSTPPFPRAHPSPPRPAPRTRRGAPPPPRARPPPPPPPPAPGPPRGPPPRNPPRPPPRPRR